MERRILIEPRGEAASFIRAASRDDLEAIAAIETSVFDTDQLSRRSLRRFLAVPTTDAVVAVVATRLAGYAMIGFHRTSSSGRLFSLAVVPAAARRGIGRALLDACEAAAWRRGCSVVRLEVRADNAAAVALYGHAGYVRVGRTEDYYEDGAAALRLAKAAPPA